VDPERDRREDLESDLKATSDDIATDARRVAEIEREKGSLATDDPRLAELAAESQALTARMARMARLETTLVDEAQERTRR